MSLDEINNTFNTFHPAGHAEKNSPWMTRENETQTNSHRDTHAETQQRLQAWRLSLTSSSIISRLWARAAAWETKEGDWLVSSKETERYDFHYSSLHRRVNTATLKRSADFIWLFSASERRCREIHTDHKRATNEKIIKRCIVGKK